MRQDYLASRANSRGSDDCDSSTLRPTGFVDAPFGLDGKVARLAGGLGWFSAVEMIGPMATRARATGAGRGDRGPARRRQAAQLGSGWRRAAPPLQLGERIVRLDQPQVVGIVNVTPDSFSDGGRFADPERPPTPGDGMAAAGAAMIDVGGESTRPGAKPVWEGDEIERVRAGDRAAGRRPARRCRSTRARRR